MILSRFFKPKWQHPDPQVRSQAVQELEAADPNLARVALEDDHPGVRRAALHRLNDPALLQRIAAGDPEPGVRDTAEARLRHLMAGGEASSPPLAQRLAVLAQAADPGLADYLAVHGVEPELRLAALERLADSSLLAELACRDPAVQVRLAAAERVRDAAGLEQVAQHARNRDKRVYRQVKARLDALRDRQQRAERAETLCRDLETLAADPSGVLDMSRFHALAQDWEAQAEAAEPDLRARWQQARERFLDRFNAQSAGHADRHGLCAALASLHRKLAATSGLSAELAAEADTLLADGPAAWSRTGPAPRAEEQRFQELLAAVRERRDALARDEQRTGRCRELLARAESLLHQAGAVKEADLDKLQERWRALPAPADPALAAELRQGFESALDRLKARLHKQSESKDQERADIETLIEHLQAALDQGELQQAITLRDQARERLRHNLALSRQDMAALERRLNGLLHRLDELRGWRRWGTHQAREHLCEEAEALAGQDEDPAARGERVKKLRAGWKAMDRSGGPAPKNLWERFDAACERAYAPVQAHHQAQAREREANLAARQALCEELERYEADTDWERPDWKEADRLWRQARERWRKLGPVNRAERRTVQQRFEAALERLNGRLDKERQREIARRQGLIQRVQSLAEGDDLKAGIEAAKQAQAEWPPTVQGPRRQEQALWQAFRAACDAVFERRQAEHQAADAERQANLEHRQALCRELETLAAAGLDSVARGRDRVEAIAGEWEAAGPPPRAEQRDLERRYGAARERFQARLREREAALERRDMDALAQRAGLCAEAEALLVGPPADPDAAVAGLRARWDDLPPLRPAQEAAVRSRFDSACQALGTDEAGRLAHLETLEADLETRKLLCLRLEILAGVDSPRDYQQARLEYQVARLSESLTARNTAQDARAEARQIETQWYATGGLPGELNAALEARFGRALEAARKMSG